MSFAFLSCLMLYLRLPILCWIKWQGWASMFFFFTNLRGKAFIIVECDVSCGLVICMLTLCSGMFHLCPLHWEFFYHTWILNFVQCFSCVYWDGHMFFILLLVNVVYYIVWFVDVEWFLYPCNESHEIIVYDPLN